MERQNAHLYIQPTPENLDGINLYEELMSAMDPVSLGASKADLQMLLKEKEQWDKEKAELLRERQLFREEKEAKERLVQRFCQSYPNNVLFSKVRIRGSAVRLTACSRQRSPSIRSYSSMLLCCIYLRVRVACKAHTCKCVCMFTRCIVLVMAH